MNLLTKHKETHQFGEWTYGCWGEGWGKGIDREFGMDLYKLLYLKWMINKDLMESTENSAQTYVAAQMEGDMGGEWIRYMCG